MKPTKKGLLDAMKGSSDIWEASSQARDYSARSGRNSEKSVSYAACRWLRPICLREDLSSSFPIGFHVVFTQCSLAKMCLCIYWEDGKLKIRTHRIGNCPDSVYGINSFPTNGEK